ncbi:Uncharacterised protein [uncultured archaeon]|nr:Uncharacterised protein [uncultured archaeon]
MEDEEHPLMGEIREGLGSGSLAASEDEQEYTKEEIARVLVELKKKMADIDKITAELNEKRKSMEKETPKKTEKMLQEIKVPSLEMLK